MDVLWLYGSTFSSLKLRNSDLLSALPLPDAAAVAAAFALSSPPLSPVASAASFDSASFSDLGSAPPERCQHPLRWAMGRTSVVHVASSAQDDGCRETGHTANGRALALGRRRTLYV